MKNMAWLRDGQAVSDYLLAFNLFPASPEEGIGYINDSLKRWVLTLEMIPPSPPSGGKLLELGSSPYLMTLLINRCFNYQLHGVNFTGDAGKGNGQYVFTAVSDSLGERYDFPYDYFNAEVDRFPYPDGEFDVVLWCEVIEHLLLDPAFVLAEAHRVLKPGGRLIVTTPNLLRWANLWKIATGASISDQYSGYGPYGRHNREYTPSEVMKLMLACGYREVRVTIKDQYEHRGLARIAKRLRHHWRDTIFATGIATGEPHYAYPDWLYRSMHACRKIVSSRIVMGENDAVQLGEGWYPREQLEGGHARWSRQNAWAYLLAKGQPQRVTLQVCALAGFLGPVTLILRAGEHIQMFKLCDDEWHTLSIDWPSEQKPDESGVVSLMISVDSTRIPALSAQSSDERELGVLVRQIELS